MRILSLLGALALAPALSGQASEPPKVDYGKLGHETVEVPAGVPRLEEKTLPRAADQEAVHSNVSAAMKGLRVYSIVVAPGEKLRLSLKCMPSKAIAINWNVPVAGDPLVAEIKRLHLNQQKMNSPRIELENRLPLPYLASFFLQGAYDVPYSVAIERVPKKKPAK